MEFGMRYLYIFGLSGGLWVDGKGGVVVLLGLQIGELGLDIGLGIVGGLRKGGRLGFVRGIRLDGGWKCDGLDGKLRYEGVKCGLR
jgi:hypothetical protein